MTDIKQAICTGAAARSVWHVSAIFGVLALFASGCGSSHGFKKPAEKNQDQRAGEFIGLSVSLSVIDPNQINGQSLALAANTEFSASITGCKSGFQRSGISAATNDLVVQKNDTECVFRLDTLTFMGENFSFQSQTQWGGGTSFEVTGSTGTVLRFAVVRNIQGRITEDQTVSMNFSYVNEGNPTNIGARVGAAVSILGADPISLEITQLDVIVMSDGAGQFTAILNCASPVANGRCGNILLSALRFGLVTNAATTLSLSECRSLAMGNTGKIKGTELPVGTPSAANGGLSVARLKGPTPLFGAGNDKLFLAASDTSSSFGTCKYYRILVRSSL
jgi:hypothetical protein